MNISDLDIRYLHQEDIPMANHWLTGWKHKGKNLNPLPPEIYPTTGMVLFNKADRTPIYIGFVWTSNSRMAQIGFITRNPFYKKKLPKGVRQEFIKALIDYCKDLGYNYVITWAENQFLVQDFKDIGLTETTNQCSELWGKIN